MVNDFLLEIGSEELPPKSLQKLSQSLGRAIEAGLQKAELAYESVCLFAAPRRLAVRVESLQQAQADKTQLRKGPAVQAAYDAEGKPTPAAIGFAKSCGVSVDELDTTKEAKGEWLSYQIKQTGLAAVKLIPDIVQQAIKALPIPKLMRWGDYTVEFVRPVHWIVMMMGSETIVSTILGKQTGNQTFGHRFHHPQAITLTEPKQYEQALLDAHVMADFSHRKQVISQQIQQCAEQCKGVLVQDDDLLDEVTAIVEWPNAISVPFDERFLAVPKEALIASMASHQKCFSLCDSNQQLLPYFITVSNIEAQDMINVIQGNERVMRARLSDAAFFFEKDKQNSLAEKSKVLENIIFQKQLGSMQEKVERLVSLSSAIAESIKLDAIDEVQKAASLSKASLVTEMVGEFPELQDVMGYYYAKHDGEKDSVAVALQEQYLPRFSGDLLPATPIGMILALSERLDTLVGIFGIGQKPTGVKDPFQLRRAALGIIRILIEHDCQLSLSALLQLAKSNFTDKLSNDDVLADVTQFFYDRLYNYFTQTLEIQPDVARAVLSDLSIPFSDLLLRAKALQAYLQAPEAEGLIQGFKRVSNMLKNIDEDLSTGKVDTDLFELDAEKTVFEALERQSSQIGACLKQQDYEALLIALTELKAPVDNYFETVMVNAEEPKIKRNRLLTLFHLQRLFRQFADLSLIQ
jgi:glycyl-tRNA synthetase beta chain